METLRKEERKWEKFMELIKNTIHSSKRLSGLISNYLAEKNPGTKKILSRMIDSEFSKNKKIRTGKKSSRTR